MTKSSRFGTRVAKLNAATDQGCVLYSGVCTLRVHKYLPMALGFPHLVGRHRPGGSPCSSPVGWRGRCAEGFMIRGWDPILCGCRWLHEPPRISDQWVGVSAPFPKVSTWGSPFRPRFVGFMEMEGFLIQRWAPILPGCGGWLYEPQPTCDRLTIGVGVSTPCGTALTQGITDFVPGFWGL